MHAAIQITHPMLRDLAEIREAAAGYPTADLLPAMLRRLSGLGLIEPGPRVNGAETVKLTSAGFLALKLSFEIGVRVARAASEPPR